MKTPESIAEIDALDEQASLWAGRLAGSSLTTAQRRELAAWLAADPRHRAQLSLYYHLTLEAEKNLCAAPEAEVVSFPAENSATPRRNWFQAAAWVAGVAAAVALAFVALRSPAPRLEQLSTAAAQREGFTLADGSRAELNARTNLELRFAAAERRVRLTAGEALFSVTKDTARPFIVETAAGNVRVTGTRFNVRLDSSGQIEVTVLEGSVQVRPEAGSTDTTMRALRPGDQLALTARGWQLRQLTSDALQDTIAWRDGQVVFEDVPLREAVARVARYHGRAVDVAPAAAALSIGGRFSLDDLPGFLAAMEHTLPVRAVARADGSYLVETK